MADKIYDWLDKMKELERKVRNKKELEWGDPDVREYNQIKRDFLNQYFPADEEEFIKFAQQMKDDYEMWLEGSEEEMREKLEPQMKYLQKTLENIADAVSPFLKQPEEDDY